MDRASPLLALLAATVLAVPGLTALRKSGTGG